MISVKTKAHVGPDGTLAVQMPISLRDQDVEVTVQPLPASETAPAAPTLEELGWPPGFFERTFGAWQGEPLERGPQGDYEEREDIV